MSEKYDVTKRIVKSVAVLSEKQNGWKKELNLISWNGREPKLDIREWDPDHEKCSKGLTLSYEEAQGLCDALSRYLQGGKE